MATNAHLNVNSLSRKEPGTWKSVSSGPEALDTENLTVIMVIGILSVI